MGEKAIWLDIAFSRIKYYILISNTYNIDSYCASAVQRSGCERALTCYQAERHRQDLCGCEPVPRRGVQQCGILWGRPTGLSAKQSVSEEDESCERALTKQKSWQNSCGCEPVPWRGVQQCGILRGRPTGLSAEWWVAISVWQGLLVQRVTFATAIRSLTYRLLTDDRLPL